jgi:hypothetical protein
VCDMVLSCAVNNPFLCITAMQWKQGCAKAFGRVHRSSDIINEKQELASGRRCDQKLQLRALATMKSRNTFSFAAFFISSG